MNPYVTGGIIKKLREERNMTQTELSQKLCVSNKAVSKWETGKGYPDITLIEPLSKALGVSVIELLSGNDVTNKNRSFNMLRSKMYVCPVCGNIIVSSGEAVISCCGITLIAAEAEECDDTHTVKIEIVEDEFYITSDHEMTKEHFISFMAAVSDNEIQTVKMYPEGNAEARFKFNKVKYICFFCNRHGLFRVRVQQPHRPSPSKEKFSKLSENI